MNSNTGSLAEPRHQRTRSGREFGFTLIEVLVVVSIIALLISILLPSLRAARTQAKIVACNANLHDFGLALNTYANDYSPYFPPTPYLGSSPVGGGDGPWGPADDNLFILWYRKYTPNIQSYSCPATTYRVRTPEKMEKKAAVNGFMVEITTAGVKNRNDFERIAQKSDNGGFGTSYEYNGWYTDGWDDPTVNWYWNKPATWKPDWTGNKLLTTRTLVFTPSRTFIMHDADEGGSVINASGGAVNNTPEPWDNHGKIGMNILFMDGHAETVKGDKQIDEVWGWKVLPDR